MKFFFSSFNFKTDGEIQFIDITDQIQEIVEKSKIHQGMVFVFSPHATGAIILNENDQPLLDDFRDLLERLIPKSGSYRHPINAHSHLRSIFMEPSKAIPVKDGKLALGTWQSIIWVEVDTRPRTRTVMVTVLGD
ncbi:MAG: YjbQ family protein [Candidatus Korarchaeota archaeon]|nr:YjbQ family protein [Candidatus Korarchaeota archaeon]